MFGSKDDYRLHNALEKIRTLTNDIERLQRHVDKLTRQVEENTNYGKKHSEEIQRLIEHTGADDGYVQFMSFDYSQSVREFKSFNLSEKIEAVLEHLGLTESVKLGNKLVPAPKKKAEKK